MVQNKLREEMARQFLAALNQGQLPWKACWQQSRPMNAATGKLYRGVNALNLSYQADELGYTDPRWCTYKQAQDNGWQVRKGEKACRVEYWAYYDAKERKLLSWQEVKDRLKADPGYEKNLQLRSRIYAVFNAAQVDGIPPMVQRHTDIGAIRQQRDVLIRSMGIGYQETGDKAYYSTANDAVTLPPEASFDDAYSYMATFLHECGHATGHPSRLNRDLSGGFGSPEYAREELRAEIASAFTAQALGLQLTDEQLQAQIQRHIAYVQNWAEVLEKSPEELFRAIKAAEEISDYLIEKGEFEQVMENAENNTVPNREPNKPYTHFYYENTYLFTVTGEELAQSVYDRLCGDVRAMGYSWSDGGKTYLSDTPVAPVSDRASADKSVTASKPFTEALYQEHIARLEYLYTVPENDGSRGYVLCSGGDSQRDPLWEHGGSLSALEPDYEPEM